MPVQVERVLGFGRSFSFWPLLFGLACCAIEMMALGGARFDMSRFGMEAMRASPRQADGMIVAGWCTTNMAPRVVRLYEQIPDPKWVLAMGSCAISGNIWDTYNVVQGIDSLIPVDVYVPGCPPRPEALWQGLEMIRERIKESRHAYDGLRRIPAREAMAGDMGPSAASCAVRRCGRHRAVRSPGRCGRRGRSRRRAGGTFVSDWTLSPTCRLPPPYWSAASREGCSTGATSGAS